MFRVLRPGGLLLFAENLRGSPLHQSARRRFVPWGETWRYVTEADIREFLEPFSEREIHTTGFSSAFVPGPEWLKTLASHLDASVFAWVPRRWNYVAYGYAVR